VAGIRCVRREVPTNADVITCEVIATRLRRLLDWPHQLGGNEPCKDEAFFFQVLPLALSELRLWEDRRPRLLEHGANRRELRHGTALRFFTAIGDLAAPYCLFTVCRCRAQCGAIKKRSLAITETAASAFARHGTSRVAKVVLLAPTTPFVLKTADNPFGAPSAYFEQMRAAWAADYPKWLQENRAPFFAPDTSPPMMDWIQTELLKAHVPTVIAYHRAYIGTDLRGLTPV
jgi:hypothetical protein